MLGKNITTSSPIVGCTTPLGTKMSSYTSSTSSISQTWRQFFIKYFFSNFLFKIYIYIYICISLLVLIVLKRLSSIFVPLWCDYASCLAFPPFSMEKYPKTQSFTMLYSTLFTFFKKKWPLVLYGWKYIHLEIIFTTQIYI